MTKPSVLVLGASGMLGHKVVEVLAAAGDVYVHAATRRPVPPAFAPASVTYTTGVDLSGGSAPLRPLLDELRPDVIVNAIGAIKQKDLTAAIDSTMYVNGSLPHTLALLNPNPAGRVIHVSTDCVFQGTRGRYRDNESPDALDLYGRSKAVGEIDYGRHLTLRTSIVGFELGSHLGLLSWFLKQPRGSRLHGFTRAVYSGLPTLTLSRVIHQEITRHEPLSGLYHVASEPITKYDMLVRLNDALALGHQIEPDESLAIDRSLDDSRYRHVTGTVRPGWDALVADLAADYVARPYESIYQQLRTSAAPATR